ncbi:hypothetical protein OnM2_039008 [Erysiphe neolycopersici]|uniref:Integrase catalytic domain-containing protein n=1 Tax=Erysiphe neolycopersici TaxID=212602 RepID=A0A420HWG1_9PEZI|nr:hypothetical protein OnM2_039008 [Erysiphe neolycopersici]
MKKFRPRILAKHKEEKLAYVSIDIAGPFPLSIDCYIYFAEIIDIFKRKKWIIFLINKSCTFQELDEWCNTDERQSECNKIVVRSDNAGEILKVLKS